MASDIFLKIGNIAGEAGDSKHKGEIEIHSWAWGVNQSGSMANGGGGGTGKATFQDLRFTHSFDSASPNLFRACAKGEHIKEAKLTMRKAGTTPQEYLIVTMNDVIVTGVTPNGNGHDDGLLENVTLQFAKVGISYKPQLEDGSLGPGKDFMWDIKANVEG